MFMKLNCFNSDVGFSRSCICFKITTLLCGLSVHGVMAVAKTKMKLTRLTKIIHIISVYVPACALFMICVTSWFIIDLCMIRWIFFFDLLEI